MKCSLIGRHFFTLCLVLAMFITGILSAHADEFVPIENSISVSTANARSVLDRRTKRITSTADITLTNISGQAIQCPFHAVIQFNGTTPDLVQVPGASGGANVLPYNTYYFVIEPGDQFLPSQSYTFNIKFIYGSSIRFTYNVVPYGVVSVPNITPIANAGPDQILTLPFGSSQMDVALDGSSSSDSDGSVIEYIWTGSPDPADEVSPALSLAAGSYQFALMVIDDDGAESENDTVQITINPPENQMPVAIAGPDRTVKLPEGYESIQITLDGSSSYDPEGDTLSYAWHGDPDPADTARPLVTLGAGVHIFSLVVNDSQGLTSAPAQVTVTVEVENTGNPPELTLEPSQFTVQEGETLEFNVSAVDPDGDTVAISAAPKLINSTFVAAPGTSATGIFTFKPDYTQAGNYAVVFKARDQLGNTSSAVAQITVTNLNRAPVLTVNPETYTIDEGELLTVKFDVTDPDEDSVDLSIEGQPETNAVFIPATGTLVFTPDYEQSGEYNITCLADDGTAEPVTKDISIIVNDVPDSGQGTTSLDLQVNPVQSPTLLTKTRITGSVNAESGAEPARLTAALITGISPAEANPGQTLDIQITGSIEGDFITHFAQGISHADFGDGVNVNELIVTGPNEAMANITVDANAIPGVREVRLITNDETAISMISFNIKTGTAIITGILLDPETDLPIAGAIVTLEGTNSTVITNQDGSFTITNAPVGTGKLIINAPDHEFITINVDARSGIETDLGPIETASNVFNPDAPPAATLASIVNRGLGVSESNLSVDEAKQLVIDTILTIGGTEAGVLDEYGNQLNPQVTGNGLVSLKDSGASEMALQLIAGDTHTLGDILVRYLRIFNYNNNEVPRLTEVLAVIQDEVNRAWLSPYDGSGLFVALFNQRRQLLGDPPQINMDTPLNALQTYIMVTSLLGYTHNTIHSDQLGFNHSPGGMLAMADTITTMSTISLSYSGLQVSPGHAGYGDIYTVGWEMVFSAAVPSFESFIKSSGTTICKVYTTPAPPSTCGNGTVEDPEECDGDPGCTKECEWAVKAPAPGCSEMANLVELLFDDRGDAATQASERFSQFFMSDEANRATAERIKMQYQSKDFQTAWTESKKDARALDKLKAFTEMSATFVMDGLAKMAGDIVNSIIAIQVELIIESVQPDPPMIYKAEQLPDPSIGELTNSVRIRFRRSHRDKGEDNAENQLWFYELWRQKGSKIARVASGRVRTPEQGPGPRPTDDPNILVFYDYDVPEGSVMYYVRAVRMMGPVPTDPAPTAFDAVLEMASGMLPLDFSTPGGTKVMGGDTLKMLLDPVAQIIKGINIQKSKFSDPEVLYVNLTPRPASPPANLVTAPIFGKTYMSIPALNKIFSIEDGEINLATESGFKAPYQLGLAIDQDGNLYTDNGASDERFGGRLFRFHKKTMGRSLIGSVNYYSQLLGYAHPVMVQAMAVGPSPAGEALYIADAMGNRIMRLAMPESLPFTDMSRNVSQPYIQSNLFNFGADTAMTFRGDGTLYLTQGNNILSVPYGKNYVEPLFVDSWAPTPFGSLSGVTIDQANNMYVSDAVQNTITQLPFGSYMAGFALKGYDEIALKKLTIARGFVRPAQLQLSQNRRGLTFIDANGLHSINFGMSGQIKDTDGNPLVGAKIIATDTVPVLASVTDGDGIFVLPDLVTSTKNIIDISIRYNQGTQTERVYLDPYKHNVVDFVFDPKTPPTGSGAVTFSEASTTNPVDLDLNPGATLVVNEQVTVQKAIPVTPPPVAEDYFPRAHVMSPADEMVVTDEQIDIKGFMTDGEVRDTFIILNGERVSAENNDGEITKTVNLPMGENTVAFGARLGGPRGDLVEALGRANNTARNETAALLPSFGSAMNGVSILAGKSARAQLSEVIPEVYRPASAVTQRAAQVEESAAIAAGQLLQGRLPENEAMDQIVSHATEFDTEAINQTEGMAVGAAGQTLELAIEAQNSVREARAQIDSNIPGLQTSHTQLGAALDNINSFLGSQTGASTLRINAQAFTTGNNVVFNDYNQYKLPDTMAVHELSQRAATVRDNVDSAVGSGDYSTAQIADLNSYRNLVIEVDEATQALHQDLAPKVGQAIAQAGMLHGMSVADMGAAITDTSVTPDFKTEAATFSAEAQGAVQGLPDAKLPANGHMVALSTRAEAMAAPAAQSPVSAGFFQAIQHQLGRANSSLTTAQAQFGQARESLEATHNEISAVRAQVDAFPADAKPAAFEDIANDFMTVHGEIEAGLEQGQLPAKAQIGHLKTGEQGSLQKRHGQMDEMFTVMSKPTQINRANEAEAEDIRRARGFHTVITGRLIDSDTGYPVGGLNMGIPGLSRTSAATDRDGVFQIKIDTNQLQAKYDEVNELYQNKVAQMNTIIANLSSGSPTMTVNEGLANIILEASKMQDDPPAVIAQRNAIASTSAEIERLATSAIADVEAGRPLSQNQLQKIQAELNKFTGYMNSMQTIIETEHNVGMSIIGNLRP